MHRLPAAVLALLLLTGAASCNSDDDDGGISDEARDAAGCTADDRMDPYTEDGNHVDAPGYKGPLSNPPTYSVNPPSGGDHLTQAAPPGIYAGLNVVPDGNLVHSLEHGYVILWYRSDAPMGDITLVRDVREQYARDTLVVERNDMPSPVAATAWEQRLLCRRANAEVLGDFIEQARNKAPEKVPH